MERRADPHCISKHQFFAYVCTLFSTTANSIYWSDTQILGITTALKKANGLILFRGWNSALGEKLLNQLTGLLIIKPVFRTIFLLSTSSTVQIVKTIAPMNVAANFDTINDH
ncbi:Uncharacterised protein [Salmonella enterica subsp. enterica serovar Typhimurium str. DT104]|nr:Uncharacterised protein [Salmonella enterica subsp. enterica serovar Typhimurium str. DT104]CQB46404.1 Uncharacterised protein [Salmonella enterica subsp. enterica serovar Typhimurium str. DT104]CQC83159.1 Uncharacterised protein [Salmonella enterica subsp. enterica serovar Typhimurium str. DT104]CQC96368.1 Uncharacterised protein [Salmonella enterica subsp. enterica serovar Typhimurium str. DT104]CQG39179.1 Uncharacterised protein [Salmonella enterica subsp. enterica serovar Typhimurium str